MRNELNIIEHIEKYLRNELSEEEQKAFEEKLKYDASLQKEVNLQREVVKGIERIGVKQSIQKASKQYENRRRGFFLGMVLLIAISGVVGIYNYANENGVEELIAVDSTEIPTEGESKASMEDNLKKNPVPVEVLKEVEDVETVNLPTKQFQYFTINSSKDEKIVGAEGTVIEFKANSFDVPQNTKLKLRLKEYYKISDIAFSNLTTETEDGRLLETGGMIYVDAKSNGKEVQLKKGEEIGVKFPVEKKKDGMKLFDGVLKDNRMVWNEATKNNDVVVEEFEEERVVESEVFTIVEQMPEIPGGIQKYLAKNVLYPKEAKDKGIQGNVFVNFTVGKDGRIRDGKILRGVNKLLDKEALRVVQNMPRWIAGMQRGVPVSVSYNLPINFTLYGSTKSYTPAEIKNFTDSLNKIQGSEGDNTLFAEGGNEQWKKRQEQVKAAHEINFYALSGSRLGWINCDRFIVRGNSTFKVSCGDGYTDVKVIFHRYKSIMKGYNRHSTTNFNRVPLGEKVTIFAIKFIDSKPFVCLLETNISKDIIQLEFEELTKEGLNNITKQISRI